MELRELIIQLKKIESALWWHIRVYIRSTYEGEIELYALVPEKDDKGEYMLILE